jgi:hypothetical protein
MSDPNNLLEGLMRDYEYPVCGPNLSPEMLVLRDKSVAADVICRVADGKIVIDDVVWFNTDEYLKLSPHYQFDHSNISSDTEVDLPVLKFGAKPLREDP